MWSATERQKGCTDLMFMLILKETIDQLAMANSVRWYGHVLRRALDFEVEGHRTEVRPKRTWKKQVEEESMNAEWGRCTLPIKVGSWRKCDCY